LPSVVVTLSGAAGQSHVRSVRSEARFEFIAQAVTPVTLVIEVSPKPRIRLVPATQSSMDQYTTRQCEILRTSSHGTVVAGTHPGSSPYLVGPENPVGLEQAVSAPFSELSM